MRPAPALRRRACRVVAGALLLATTSCASVAAYERGRLAHRTMNPDDALSLGAEHVYAVHEGAVGGTVSASSGCGCN